METIMAWLLYIPTGLGYVLAVIGLVPFFMALKSPPATGVKAFSYGAVYCAGALGMLSVLAQLFSTAVAA